jgi:hypothetical protein
VDEAGERLRQIYTSKQTPASAMRCKTRVADQGTQRGAAHVAHHGNTGKPMPTTANNVQREIGAMPKNRRARKLKQTPRLVRLTFGPVYCELDRREIKTGELVAWWRVPRRGGRLRWTAYCADCHWANVNAGKALQ